MTTIKFSMDVDAGGEVYAAQSALLQVVKDFGFPVYHLVYTDEEGGTNELTNDLGGLPGDEDDGEACNALIDEQEARDADVPPRCGDLVEVNGFEYVVSAETIDGTLELSLRDELQDDEDSFFCPPTERSVH